MYHILQNLHDTYKGYYLNGSSFSATHHYPTEVRVHPHGSTSVDVTWRGVLITTDEATVIGYKVCLSELVVAC